MAFAKENQAFKSTFILNCFKEKQVTKFSKKCKIPYYCDFYAQVLAKLICQKNCHFLASIVPQLQVKQNKLVSQF